MARTTSAKKAARVALRRRVFNLRRKHTMKEAVKNMGKLIASAKGGSLPGRQAGASGGKGAEALLPALYKAIDKAVKNGTIKRNTAARMKSRITKRLRAVAA